MVQLECKRSFTEFTIDKMKKFYYSRARAYYLLCAGCKQSFTEFLKKRISTFDFFFYIINVIK